LSMSNMSLSAWARPGELAAFRRRQRSRFNLTCENLENRYLLSTTTSATDLSQISALPSLDVLPLVSSGPTGLSPQQLASAYGVNQITFSGGKVVGNGAGQTIAIVTAYNDPKISSDLAAFDSYYGISAPPSLTVKNLGGTKTDAGWALETSLDVEWAHALAPAANILVVEATSSSLSSLFSAVSYASKQAGVSVVSMSWGTYEFSGESSYDSSFTTQSGHSGVTYVAASGDSGAWNGPMYPSVSPNVLAVGGTTLSLSGTTYGSESAWSGSTGGFSGLDSYWRFYEAQPSYQNAALQAVGLSYGVRTTPDVSLDADPDTGVAVYDSVGYSGQSGWFQLGGTSAAAPAWAALIAIADQGLATGGKGPLSGTQAQTELYSLPSSDFHDITAGYNGYSATSGYDLVSGLGSPKANLVIAGLLSANGVASTSVAKQVTVATSTTSSSKGSHLDQTVSSISGTGIELGTPTNVGGNGASGLTSNLDVDGQGGGSAGLQALSTAVSTVQSQLVAPIAVSGTPANPSSVAASTSLPGQSLPDESETLTRRISIKDQPVDVIDDTTAAPANALVQTVALAPMQEEAVPQLEERTPTAEPARATGLHSDTPLVLPKEPKDDFATEIFDLALAQVIASMPPSSHNVSLALPEQENAPADQPTLSMSTVAGATLVVAGGYRLVLGRSDGIRRRWSPRRFR
jgi:hypothetical protein